MTCPYCGHVYKCAVGIVNAQPDFEIPPVVPFLCMACGELSSMTIADNTLRKPTVAELERLEQSPVWQETLAQAKQIMFSAKKAAKALNN